MATDHLASAWKPGQSGNPGGRPKGLANATREVVGDDGLPLAQLWWEIASDKRRKDSDRLEASRLLADRGWGKAPAFAPIGEGDPLELTDVGKAIEQVVDELAGKRTARAVGSSANGKVAAASPDG